MRILVLGAVIAFSSCSVKTMVMQSPIASMKKNNLPDGQKVTEGDAVKETWCTNEPPVRDQGSDHAVGLIDQALLKAHKNNADTDFFTNVRVYQISEFMKDPCYQIEANKGKLVRK